MSLFEKLKERLVKTRAQLFGRISDLLRGTTSVDRAVIQRIEEILLSADIGVTTTGQIIRELEQRVKKEKITDPARLNGVLEEIVEQRLVAIDAVNLEDRVSTARPFVILVVGVNGTGKTTTIGKLAHRFARSGRRVLLAAADTFRAAAASQLDIWAQRTDVDIVRQMEGADPAAVVFDALESAKSKNIDVVLIDTAGRLHTKTNLMEELKKIRRVVEKQIPGAPHATLLVLDAGTGQNAIQQAREFSNTVGVTGLVLTKLDGTAKGGVVIAIQNELKIPVAYIGVGEKVEDLEPFRVHDFVGAILE
jgi:fused signal recognition particle receptor